MFPFCGGKKIVSLKFGCYAEKAYFCDEIAKELTLDIMSKLFCSRLIVPLPTEIERSTSNYH